MKTSKTLFAATLLLLAPTNLPAQIGSSPYNPSIASLQFEAVVPLGAITGSDVLFAGAPDSVLAALKAGILEIHEWSTYDSDMNKLKSVLFLVPAGSPLPSPQVPSDDNPNVIGAFTMRVDTIYWNAYDAGMTAAVIGRVSTTPDQFQPLIPLGSTYILSFQAPVNNPGTVARVVGMFPAPAISTAMGPVASPNSKPLRARSATFAL